eukprot:gnl/Ergobibamus_cyprinoides/476.p3 GENE.gnl/Ergobibamus_cyprinoides/476~~gnl/Ergobibamus_cyprinoides/476.p3  ORF type:complete len:127 (+),score=11.65 gnl/Ergobibamus_cyprinoides/476:618-998(+)
MDPEAMNALMDSPMFDAMMDTLMGNPELMQQSLRMSGLDETDPSVAAMVSNPAMLRASVEMMRAMRRARDGSHAPDPGVPHAAPVPHATPVLPRTDEQSQEALRGRHAEALRAIREMGCRGRTSTT